MKILLDTHTFLWLANDSPELSKKARSVFLDPDCEFFLSLASAWEIAIKSNLDKLSLPNPIEKFIPIQLQENNITQLDVTFRHIVKIATLPLHHRDPFDRLIIAQAMEEQLPIMSSDKIFDKYPIKRLW